MKTEGDFFPELEKEVDFSEDIPADASSDFRRWVFRMLAKDQVEPIVRALIRGKKVSSRGEAIKYLEELSRDFDTKKHLTALDFKGGSLRVLKRLRDELAVTINEGGKQFTDTLYRIHGVVGHIAIPQLLLVKKERPCSENNANQQEFLSLVRTKEHQTHLFDKSDSFRKYWDSQDFLSRPRLNREVVKKLDRYWKWAVRVAKRHDRWFAQYEALRFFQRRIQKLLIGVFGEKIISQVIKNHGPLSRYLIQLTLLSWANSVVYAYGYGRRVIFREVPVLAHQHGINGGRIDALELVSVNGRPPTHFELKILTDVVERYEVEGTQSVGQLVLSLERLFPKRKLKFHILDWKFAVGDSPEISKVVEASDVKKEPFPKHADQIRRYLTLASLDYHLALRGNKEIIWGEDKHFDSGTLVYFFPLVRPVVHQITMTPKEKERFFVDHVVQVWHRANERAGIRVMSNFLIGHALSSLTIKKNGNGNGNGNGHSNGFHLNRHSSRQVQMFNGGVLSPIERMVERYRKFVDENRMFEIIGTGEDGESVFLFHFDNFKIALQNGKTSVESNFSWERGGKILCPIHEDKNPSLHIYVGRRYVKCFVCGAYARISNEGLISVQPHLLREFQRVLKPNQTLQDLVIPKRHADIMSLAYVFMSGDFPHSPGEVYLEKERRLDPSLALQMKAGFYNEKKFINDFLDSGVSFEELVYYGFIGFSNRISKNRSLVPILIDRGLSLKKIQKIDSSKDSSPKLPYSVLRGRVTFPLWIDGKIVSFYGRYAGQCEKHFAHRKLLVSESNIPHGIFNEEPLTSGAEEITVVEAPIDAIALTQLGHKDVSGIVGVRNFVVLELIARSGKRVAIALDNDQAGKESTYGIVKENIGAGGNVQKTKIVGLLEWFENRGLRGKVRDFTAEYASQFNNVDWKDWNDVLKIRNA